MRFFQFTPGSFWWLLSHELRLFFYEMGDASKASAKSKKTVRGMSLKTKLLLAIVWVGMHVLVWSMLEDMPMLSQPQSVIVFWATSFVLLLISTFMLSSALNRSVKALFERGDLDLLLSSPMNTQTIFTVRLTAIVVGVLAVYVFFLSPVINVAAFLGTAGRLNAYPVLCGMAMLVVSAAMLLTLSLVKLIGVKRTHTVAYLLGALSGAAFFLMTQIFSHLGDSSREAVLASVYSLMDQHQLLTETSWLLIPARAVFGVGDGAVVIFGCGLLVCWMTARYTHQFFVRGVQQASSVSVPPASVAGAFKPPRFRRGVWPAIFIKEWRLLLRDIELLSQICLQMLYMLPLFFVIFKDGAMLPGVVAGLTYLTISLSGSLIWVIVSAEDMPDLLQCAPVPAVQIRLAKLAAAILPVGLLLTPAVIWLCARDYALGLTLAMTSLGGVICTALLYQWLSKPMTRDRFKQRGQGNLVPVFLETLNGLSWTAIAAGLLPAGRWGWFGVVGAGLVLLLAWMLRLKPN